MKIPLGLIGSALAAAALVQGSATAGVVQYGDEDLLNTGTYSSDPKAGATLEGLAPGVITVATNSYGHSYPFSPTPGDYAGTDQIYVGNIQTASHDGYSNSGSKIHGPQVITLDYSSLLSPGQVIDTFTLGIAADDFQRPTFGQRFIATINGATHTRITTQLNAFNQTGPRVQFFTVGISPTLLLDTKVLTLTIDELGDGGDGWALDFLTIGITAQAVPEPSTIA